MKKLIVLLVLMSSMMIKAADVVIDSSKAVAQAAGATSDNTSKLYEDGKSVLKNITVGTGDALKTGFDIVVKQQLVYSIQYLLVGLICIIFLLLFLKYYTNIKADKPNSYFPAIMFLACTVFTAIVFAMHFSQVVQGLVNPEYSAIRDVIDMTSKLVSK